MELKVMLWLLLWLPLWLLFCCVVAAVAAAEAAAAAAATAAAAAPAARKSLPRISLDKHLDPHALQTGSTARAHDTLRNCSVQFLGRCLLLCSCWLVFAAGLLLVYGFAPPIPADFLHFIVAHTKTGVERLYMHTYIYIYMCVCECVRLCMSVCIYVCVSARMYVCMYVRVNACTYVCNCMHAYLFVCMYVCMYAVAILAQTFTFHSSSDKCCEGRPFHRSNVRPEVKCVPTSSSWHNAGTMGWTPAPH